MTVPATDGVIDKMIPGKGNTKESDSKNRSQTHLGSLVQGGLEPIVALGREDLGFASVLSRTDGQGADIARCRTAEMTAFFLPR